MLIASLFNIFNICIFDIKKWLLKMIIVKKSLQYIYINNIYNININYKYKKERKKEV